MPRLDPRDYQILFLGCFWVLGVTTRNWTLQPSCLILLIAVCVSTQAILSKGFDQENQQPISVKSALITALGLSLLLRADQFTTLAIAGSVAILSKFLIRVQEKHVFNPANFGIVVVLGLTQDAWVSPGQWGESSWLALVFIGLGGIVLQKVERWDTSGVFLGSYALLEGLRNIWLGWSWDVWAHRLSSGSLLLFALFMITDPRSIPDARSSRLLWAVTLAVLTFGLRNIWFVPEAPFYALFILAPLTPLLDWLWRAPRFQWGRSVPSSPSAESIAIVPHTIA